MKAGVRTAPRADLAARRLALTGRARPPAHQRILKPFVLKMQTLYFKYT